MGKDSKLDSFEGSHPEQQPTCLLSVQRFPAQGT
jgi:hypothetical protein